MQNQDSSTRNLKAIKSDSLVYQRHLALYERYLKNPKLAWITDSSEVISMNLQDPFRTLVLVNDTMKVPFKVGVHNAVGGDSDFPNPGDLLCASLASCFESTLRMISNKLGIQLLETKIMATAQVDVRGSLLIDKDVPVEFQRMHIDAFISAKDSSEKLMNTLIKGVKNSCIIYQTIKRGTPITLNTEFKINT